MNLTPRCTMPTCGRAIGPEELLGRVHGHDLTAASVQVRTRLEILCAECLRLVRLGMGEAQPRWRFFTCRVCTRRVQTDDLRARYCSDACRGFRRRRWLSCAACGALLDGRSNRRYCPGGACRQKAWRQRHATSETPAGPSSEPETRLVRLLVEVAEPLARKLAKMPGARVIRLEDNPAAELLHA